MDETGARVAAPPRAVEGIAAEAVLIAGGGRAILLQIAHQSVGSGVADHSDFVSDPLRRLQHTLGYVYVQLYGTPVERELVRSMVESAHDRVRGTDTAGGSYSAHDPELQLWVAATLYDSAIRIHERVYGPLPSDIAEAIYLDYAILGTGLRMGAEQWPSDTAAFADYWNAELPELRVSDQARAIARELLAGKTLPLWLRLGMPVARIVTIGTLPESLRIDYGFDWSPRHERRFRRTMAVISAVYPALPRRLRHWPKNYLMRGIRRLAQSR